VRHSWYGGTSGATIPRHWWLARDLISTEKGGEGAPNAISDYTILKWLSHHSHPTTEVLVLSPQTRRPFRSCTYKLAGHISYVARTIEERRPDDVSLQKLGQWYVFGKEQLIRGHTSGLISAKIHVF